MTAGVRFTAEQFAELLAALPRDTDGRLVLRDADFRLAELPTFDLSSASFEGFAEFGMARFKGKANFTRATFRDGADFGGADFHDGVYFERAGFHADAWFWEATFLETANFEDATFRGVAWFNDATFKYEVKFSGSTFEKWSPFDGARFHDNAWFYGTSFESGSFHDTHFEFANFSNGKFTDVEFFGARFDNDASFEWAQFNQAIVFMTVAVRGTLNLDWVIFNQPVQLTIAAWRLSLLHTRFQMGGHLRVEWAEVSLEGAEIPSPLIISSGLPESHGLENVSWLSETDDHDTSDFPPPRPILLSVQRADVAGLVLTDIDLRHCRFAGAHSLDHLQTSTENAFHRAPNFFGGGRLVIAEECELRQTRGGRQALRWRQAYASPHLELVDDMHRPKPDELAAIYRQLRKGREDAKNEPGASDFYYGEMEMRRIAPDTPWGERVVLWLYWLASGYGLRGLRSLGWLAATVLATGIALHHWGFYEPAPPLWATILYSTQSIISLDTKLPQLNGRSLTAIGEVSRLSIRLLGPVFLGLTLLALRGRVKR